MTYSMLSVATLDDLLSQALSTPPGAWVEVGVYRGGSAEVLYRAAQSQSRLLYLYDTFTGQPWADWDDPHPVGDFSDTDFEAIWPKFPRAYVTQGIFPDSAIPMPPIAFAHLDCDQYRSVKDSILYLLPRMVKGGILRFDDSPALAGARRAVLECFQPHQVETTKTGQDFVRV